MSETGPFRATVYLAPAAFGIPGPAIEAITFAVAADSVADALEIAFAVCNSHPTELVCPSAYADVVARYRAARHRSLSVGDRVRLRRAALDETYRCDAHGWSPTSQPRTDTPSFPAQLDPPPTTIYALGASFGAHDYFRGGFRNTAEPDDIRHDNLRRAGFAASAVLAFAARNYHADEDLEAVLSDLMCDLMHLADAARLDFDQLAARGRDHYRAELGGEP